MKTSVAWLLLILWVTTACTPTVSNKAQDLLDSAISHYSNAQYATAKLLIDSIQTQFPKQIDIRKKAHALMYYIEQQEVKRNIAYLDSVMPIMYTQWDSVATQFRMPASDTLYISEYLYKHKTFQKQSPATGLYCEINDEGDMYLISVYTGRVLDHTQVTVSCGDIYAQTQEVPLNHVSNYQFTDLGVRWEYITFGMQNQNDVLGFIATYANEPLTVTLHGKRTYRYTLPAKTAKAMAQSVQFAKQTAVLYQLKKSYQLSTDKLLWLEQKIQASDSLLVL